MERLSERLVAGFMLALVMFIFMALVLMMIEKARSGKTRNKRVPMKASHKK